MIPRRVSCVRWNQLQPGGQSLPVGFSAHYTAMSDAEKEVCGSRFEIMMMPSDISLTHNKSIGQRPNDESSRYPSLGLLNFVDLRTVTRPQVMVSHPHQIVILLSGPSVDILSSLSSVFSTRLEITELASLVSRTLSLM